jgi:hypothetical protein
VLVQVLSNGQQQRPAAGEDNPLPVQRETVLSERLQAAGSHDVRKSPAGKGQKPLAGSGGQDEVAVTQFKLARRKRFEREPSGCWGGEYAGTGKEGHPQTFGGGKPGDCAGGELTGSGPPDLAARPRIIVHHRDGSAASRGAAGRRQTRRPGADDQDVIEAVRHR